MDIESKEVAEQGMTDSQFSEKVELVRRLLQEETGRTVISERKADSGNWYELEVETWEADKESKSRELCRLQERAAEFGVWVTPYETTISPIVVGLRVDRARSTVEPPNAGPKSAWEQLFERKRKIDAREAG